MGSWSFNDIQQAYLYRNQDSNMEQSRNSLMLSTTVLLFTFEIMTQLLIKLHS